MMLRKLPLAVAAATCFYSSSLAARAATGTGGVTGAAGFGSDPVPGGGHQPFTRQPGEIFLPARHLCAGCSRNGARKDRKSR